MITSKKDRQLVYTVKDRCRVCYTCVRECPVKAIRILNGQAEVISDRCIGCGNCVKVCSQDAKAFLDSKEIVRNILQSEKPVIAILAPSFPAEFTEVDDPEILIGMIRALGFDKVLEVSFGADMVAREYNRITTNPEGKHYISSDCPAIVNYVEHYHPDMVEHLAPIVSPMVATARIARKKFGDDIKIVFIGPCIAKKAESDEIDEGITFKELREMFYENSIDPNNTPPQQLDEPVAGKGAIFPVSRGLLHTSNQTDDYCESNILVTEGKGNFSEAIKEFEDGLLNSQHLQLLCCEGCIMGPGMTKCGKKFERTLRVSDYVKSKLDNLDEENWNKNTEEFGSLDYSQQFRENDRRNPEPSKEQLEKVFHSMGKFSEKDHLNCGACGYASCHDHAIAILEGLAESEMCLPYTIEKLHKSVDELNESNDKLASAKQALRQSEKLASMGQLSAGIAHELNNPLGVITMYSNILKDESTKDSPFYQDLELIVEQTERCKNIVGGLLNFARKNQVRLTETNIADFIKSSINSIIHNGDIEIVFENQLSDPIAMIDKEQMMQVLTNLEKNAVEAMTEGGRMSILLSGDEDKVIIQISDTGSGVPKEHMDKLFTPFFTTKGVGKGTGLGLPLVYGIVKMHKGKIHVHSNSDPAKGPTGTTFTIEIPKNNSLK